MLKRLPLENPGDDVWRVQTSTLSLMTALLVAACLPGASSDGVARCSEAECGPFEYRDAFFPMAVGNTWIFTDSLFTDTGVIVTEHLRRIGNMSVGSSGVAGWWFSAGPPPPYTGFFSQRNDTTYQWIATRSGLIGETYRYIPPEGGDTISFSSSIEDDVPVTTFAVAIDGEYVTAAGTFTDCALYTTEQVRGFDTVRTVLCAGIGPVSHDLDYSSSPLNPGTFRKLRLKTYDLMQ